MEQTADAGEVVVSTTTAGMLPPRCVGSAKDAGWLLQSAPPAVPCSRWWPPATKPDTVAGCLDPALSEHLLTEVGDSEHRQVALGVGGGRAGGGTVGERGGGGARGAG